MRMWGLLGGFSPAENFDPLLLLGGRPGDLGVALPLLGEGPAEKAPTSSDTLLVRFGELESDVAASLPPGAGLEPGPLLRCWGGDGSGFDESMGAESRCCCCWGSDREATGSGMLWCLPPPEGLLAGGEGDTLKGPPASGSW